MYIPISVTEINMGAFEYTRCTIHCAEHSFAHRLAVESKRPFTLDPSLNISEVTETPNTTAFAFCSYADDKKDEAERIIVYHLFNIWTI